MPTHTSFDDHVAEPRVDVTCVRCGRVSFVMPRERAERHAAEVRRDFVMRRPAQVGRAPRFDPSDYSCLDCGGTAFRPARDGECPDGCTICPVIVDGMSGTMAS